MSVVVSNKSRRYLITAITIGSILEWYEIFLYIYWAPIIQGIFFDSVSQYINFINTVLVFAFGFLSRPLGGIIFGYIGDRFGRKKSLTLSIMLAAVPSILIGCTPSYLTWSNFSAIFLLLMRLLQGIPAGGELPGAMCYLEEIAPPKRRIYMGSYTFVGAQIGGIISMLTCMAFQLFFSHQFLVNWGWRISFIIGGGIGLFGFYLRENLKETPYFEHLKERHQISKKPFMDALRNYKWKMLIAFFVSLSEVMGFFTIAIFPVIYFNKIFGTSSLTNIGFSASLLTISAITIPIFGHFGDKINYKSLLAKSMAGMIVVSFPFYFSVKSSSLLYTIICELIFIFFLNIQLAYLPSLLTALFPTSVRFTCLGFSFNVSDGLIGGISPFLAIFLIQQTSNPAAFVFIFLFASIISLIFLSFIKEKEELPDGP